MHTYNEDKMYTYLKGFFSGAHMRQSMDALGFAREKHEGYTRKGNGQPYIVHPLWMACYATALGIYDDDILSAILLHDVPEDTKTPISDLPVSDNARKIVDCMTIKKYPNDTKWSVKERYFKILLDNPGAIICKGIDRLHNLSTMENDLKLPSIEKNVVETNVLLLPAMKIAKEKWPSYANPIFVIRTGLYGICDTLDGAHHISERQNEIIEKMKNTPALEDNEDKNLTGT